MVASQDLEKLEIELEKAVYKKSYYEFFKMAFCQAEPGNQLNDNWHIEYLCEIGQREVERIVRKEKRKKHLIINVPPRSAKSHIFTRMLNAWAWAYHPELKFITVSFSGSLATEHSMDTKGVINSVWYQRLYRDVFKFAHDQNEKTHYKNNKGGERKARGTGSQITGSGADIVICDDPQDPQQATSEKEIENTIFFYDKVLASRLNNSKIGIFIVVQQRLAERDLTGHILKDRPQYYSQVSIPAEYDEEIVSPPELKDRYVNELYFPKRFDRSVLAEKKDELKGEYPGQYQQRPTFKEGAILKRNWFTIIPVSSVVRDPKDKIVFFLDTAYTQKQENDPTGIMSCFFSSKDQKLYITHAGSYRKEFHALIPFIKEYVSSHGYQSGSIIRVEPKASGLSVIQVLKNNGMNVSKIDNDFVKMDKVTRANTISPYCESERVVLVEGNWNEEFLTQITSFPKSAHDEYVDTLAYAVAQYMIYNSVGFGWA